VASANATTIGLLVANARTREARAIPRDRGAYQIALKDQGADRGWKSGESDKSLGAGFYTSKFPVCIPDKCQSLAIYGAPYLLGLEPNSVWI